MEQWKDIPGYEGLYEISSLGNVRRADTGIAIKAYKRSQDPYLSVNLWRNNKARHVRVHRLVATVFIPNPDNKPCVDHIDTNCCNNAIDNLRWCTHRENSLNILTRQHNSLGQQIYNQQPGIHEKRCAISKTTRLAHKDTFDNITQQLVTYSRSAEGKAKNAAAQKRVWADPDFHAKHANRLNAHLNAHPEVRERIAEQHRQAMRTKEARDKIFNGSLHRASGVYCIETKETFLSAHQADRKFSLWLGAANWSAKTGKGTANGKLHFKYVEQ